MTCNPFKPPERKIDVQILDFKPSASDHFHVGCRTSVLSRPGRWLWYALGNAFAIHPALLQNLKMALVYLRLRDLQTL